MARANAIVLVSAVLVLLVIIATAFVVRGQGGRVQAAASQASAGRTSRAETIAQGVAQEVADALFPRLIDRNRMAEQVAANQASGLQGRPLYGEFLARSDYPRLPPSAVLDADFGAGAQHFPEMTGIRYGVDPLDFMDNRTLGGPPAVGGAAQADGMVDGYNFAPYSVIPYTNWPARYGYIPGESGPYGSSVGNPGFGDSRWLASTEPLRARVVREVVSPIMPAPPNTRQPLNITSQWSNLALSPQRAPVLDPEGLGFSHWPHLSWIATPENGFRVAWNIAALDPLPAGQGEYLTNGGESGVLAGSPGSVAGELALGIPYEQWLTNVAPAEAALLGADPDGFLVLDRDAWKTRVREWFNIGVGALNPDSPAPHEQIVRGVGAGGQVLAGPGGAQRRAQALPNFLQLAAFGTPADEFRMERVGSNLVPHSRNLVSRTLADADGDGWTDSFWFLAPSSSDRGTRQLVAVRIVDNSGMVNVNTATRFERTNTVGQTPSDVALVTRRESYDETVANTPAANAAFRDPLVGFFNSRENDPEYRSSFNFYTPGVGAVTLPGAAQYAPSLIYAVDASGGVPRGGVDVGWAPERWEGRRTQLASAGATAADTYQSGVLRTLGLVTEGASGQTNGLLPFFDPSAEYGNGTSAAVYGDMFLLTRPVDRRSYFKAMAAEGEILDPITGTRLASLAPFGNDDEVELRAANGLNTPLAFSRLEGALNDGAPMLGSEIRYGQYLRSTRSREETSRFFAPDDVRTQDWRARAAWAPGASVTGKQDGFAYGVAARSGTELLLDHRRLLTTISGARNEMLPPRLWTIRDHSRHGLPANPFQDPDENINNRFEEIASARPAYVGTAAAGGLPPYHPNVMFTNSSLHPAIPPAGGVAPNPYAIAVNDANRDGEITAQDFVLARRRFLLDNRKIDLRRPVDDPVPAPGNPVAQQLATFADVREETWGLMRDVQRVMRRALVDEDSGQSYLNTIASMPDPTAEPTLRRRSIQATKLMALSFATNLMCWRDGARPLGGNFGAADQPFHPNDLPAISTADGDLAAGFSNIGGTANSTFVGVEKQPFIQEAFIAFVYPPATQSVIQQALDAAGVADCDATSDVLPQCTGDADWGQRLVGYDPAVTSTHPAVVMAVQLANPYNEPVGLSDFVLRLNFASRTVLVPLRGSYGVNAELGPCTPEEPRSLIVFSVPDIFPDGRPFPRDAWLDFLDLRAQITDRDGNNRLENTDYVVTAVGADFAPDARALFKPAIGALRTQNSRGGTLLVDGTALINRGHSPANGDGIPQARPLSQWQPAASASMVELVRQVRPVFVANPGSASSALVVVDRLKNVLESSGGGSSTATPNDGLGEEEDFDQRVRQLTDTGSGTEPARAIPPAIVAVPAVNQPPGGGIRPVQVSGLRIGLNDSFVTWARTSRQWLFDTQLGVQSPGPGLGRITLDERAPRWVASRQTGTKDCTDVWSANEGGVSRIRDFVDGKGIQGTGDSASVFPVQAPGRTVSFFETVDGQPSVAGRVYCLPDGGILQASGQLEPGSQGDPRTLPIVMKYFDVWGRTGEEQRIGKPTFFPSRIVTHGTPGGPDNRSRFHRRYDYPEWGLTDANLLAGQDGASVSYGEKGAVQQAFVDGTRPWAWTWPMRMFQKDADFDQVAEILDVPLWGPVVDRTSLQTLATLPEILAQGPKAAASFPMPAGRGRREALNKLVIDPPVFQQVQGAGTDGRVEVVSGVPVLPGPADPALGPTLNPLVNPTSRQGGIGFNSSLVGGAALLDAFTVDDRGQLPFDADADGVLEQADRAPTEDRRFRLARNFEGRLTPGLVNINTAPVEVLRSLPQMLRLVYDDDFPITIGANSNPATLYQPASQLGLRRGLRDATAGPNVPATGATPPSRQEALWAAAPFDDTQGLPGPTNPWSILFDFGIAAPRIRLPEAIELWRNKGNIQPTLAGHQFVGMPSYFDRGLHPDAVGGWQTWATGSRVERGFDSIGELALLTQGARVTGGTPTGWNQADWRSIAAGKLPDVNRNGIDDRQERADFSTLTPEIDLSWNTIMGWSIRYPGMDPYRTRWGRTTGADTDAQQAQSAGWGRGMLTGNPLVFQPATFSGGTRPYTDGIPRNLAGTAVQQFPFSGRTAIDEHLLKVATDNPATPNVETDDPATTGRTETELLRHDLTAGDAIEQNQLLKGISNIVTTRSDVFTVWLRIRTIRQDRLTGRWNGADPALIVDDSRYMMTIDRSSVDRPGERPRILNFVKVNN